MLRCATVSNKRKKPEPRPLRYTARMMVNLSQQQLRAFKALAEQSGVPLSIFARQTIEKFLQSESGKAA